MNEECKYNVLFTQGFDLCLDRIEDFFAVQDIKILEWWQQKEDEIIDYISQLLSVYPYVGIKVQNGPFKGLKQITYGKGKHKMLNYVIFYAVHKNTQRIDVINISPSRAKRKNLKNKI